MGARSNLSLSPLAFIGLDHTRPKLSSHNTNRKIPCSLNKYFSGELVVEGALFVALLHEWIRCIFIVFIYTELTERRPIGFYIIFILLCLDPIMGYDLQT